MFWQDLDALIGGGSTPATATGPARCIRMVNPKQFRAQAEECEAKAETAHDPDVRRWYRNIAAQWRKLAQQHEELGIRVRWVLDHGPRLERDRQRLTR